MKIRIQIPHGKFGVIEISDIEATSENLIQKLGVAKKLIAEHSKVEDAFGGSRKPFNGASEKQKKLIADLGGDVNKTFATGKEVSEYIGELFKNKPKKQEVKQDTTKDVPWQVEL